MKDVKKPKGYIGLMERMAEHMGIDLTQCQDELGISPFTIERMMEKCSACGESADCVSILSQPQTADSEQPPSYCCNRKVLMHLARSTAKSD
ncbi:hypothetical protein SAMN05444000_1162 [Shimia gijangensis]|uniref:DUF6455 domain-containing protein n=2 Tax=Shimia gijangensis TaxID=1470563 RepID=A0A1M6NHN6_9RHOB|nr:hypothetical protein SAMN05444000_1162 [Shimia gijangensis]